MLATALKTYRFISILYLSTFDMRYNTHNRQMYYLEVIGLENSFVNHQAEH